MATSLGQSHALVYKIIYFPAVIEGKSAETVNLKAKKSWRSINLFAIFIVFTSLQEPEKPISRGF